MDSHRGNPARLGQTMRFGLQSFNVSVLQELHMWLKHARWPKTHTVLNTQHLSRPAKPPNTRHVVNTELNPLECELAIAKLSTRFKRSFLQFVWQIDLFYSLMPTSPVHLNNTSLEGWMAGGFGDRKPELFIFTSLVWIQQRLIVKENISHLPNA